MLLKILFLVMVGVFLFRLFGGKVPFLDKETSSAKEEEQDFEKIEVTSACATCGTYITEDDALIFQKKSYCSTECLEKAK
jgi:uncharacterized protein